MLIDEDGSLVCWRGRSLGECDASALTLDYRVARYILDALSVGSGDVVADVAEVPPMQRLIG